MAKVNEHSFKELRRTRQMAVKDVIERTKAFHNKVASIYDLAYAEYNQEEMRMLLGILAKHERRIIERLDAYTQKAAPKVLNTRIMYVPEIPLDTLHENVVIAIEQGREEVADAALKMSGIIIKLYDTIVECTTLTEVQEALQSLREFEEKEMIYALRSTELE